MIDEQGIRYRWETVGRNLGERGQRLPAATVVRAAGHGGLKIVSANTGLACSTINRGEDDFDGEPLEPGRVRRKGGGRKSVAEKDPGLVPALLRIGVTAKRGDPVRPLTWVSLSMDKIAVERDEGATYVPDCLAVVLAEVGDGLEA